MTIARLSPTTRKAAVALLLVAALAASLLISEVDPDRSAGQLDAAAGGPGPEAGKVGLVLVNDRITANAKASPVAKAIGDAWLKRLLP